VVGTLDIYRRLLGVQLRSQLQFPVSFALDLTSTALITVIEFGSVVMVMWRFQALGGWTIHQVAFLYGLVEMSFGLMDIVFSGFDPQTFGQNVRRGSFDQVLLRPVSVTAQVMGSRFMLRRIGKIVLGATILIFGIATNDIDWDLFKLAYLPFVVVGQVAFFGGLFMIGSAITFWTVESIETINIFTYGGKELCSYPMHIYPRWMRLFFTLVVPAIFLNYYPAIYFLGLDDPLGMPRWSPFMAPLAGLAVFVVARWFWHFGIRHYQSTGS
jgi:ABC-2 type transport system permease protein